MAGTIIMIKINEWQRKKSHGKTIYSTASSQRHLFCNSTCDRSTHSSLIQSQLGEGTK